MLFREIRNFSNYIHNHKSKQRNVDKKQIKNTGDFFSQIRLYFVSFHTDDVMTES